MCVFVAAGSVRVNGIACRRRSKYKQMGAKGRSCTESTPKCASTQTQRPLAATLRRSTQTTFKAGRADSSASRSYGEVIDDASITSAVKSKLLWSKNTEGLATNVDTKQGKVTLKGSADSAATKDLAGRLTMGTRGVTSVDNQLMVKSAKPTSADAAKTASQDVGSDMSDGWITTKVKSTYTYSSNVDGSDISVNTAKGIVVLSGKVDSGAERALAIELAQNVRGVKSVESKALTL